MEKQTFRTLIKADHKLGGNEYIKGRITGMAYVICEVYKSIPHGIGKCDEGDLLRVDCTEDQYKSFVKLVSDSYPGLCEFYYKGSK